MLEAYARTLREELTAVREMARMPAPETNETDREVLHELLADAYLGLAGVPADVHSSECATNQAPAYRPGPCDCGAARSRPLDHLGAGALFRATRQLKPWMGLQAGGDPTSSLMIPLQQAPQ